VLVHASKFVVVAAVKSLTTTDRTSHGDRRLTVAGAYFQSRKARRCEPPGRFFSGPCIYEAVALTNLAASVIEASAPPAGWAFCPIAIVDAAPDSAPTSLPVDARAASSVDRFQHMDVAATFFAHSNRLSHSLFPHFR
jgi:hypothetical protein